MKQEQDETRVPKGDGSGVVSLPSQRRVWPASPLPSESLRCASLMFDDLSSHLSPILHPFDPCKLGHSPALKSHTHWHCLLLHFQIQGMAALPPAIERPHRAEPSGCTSPSPSLHGKLSLRLLACLTVLGSVLSSVHWGPNSAVLGTMSSVMQDRHLR